MKKRLLERGLSLLLAFVMVLALAPVFTIEAEAANATAANLAQLINSTTSGTIVLTEDAVLSGGIYTIKPDVTLLLPYAKGTDTINDPEADLRYANTAESAYRVSAITLPKDPMSGGVLLTLTNGAKLIVEGKLVIGGQHAGGTNYTGQTYGSYSKVVLEESAEILVSGILSCYGYITGSGMINVSSTGSIYEPFVITNYGGGTYSLNVYKTIAPFTSYALVNIQVPMDIMAGGALYGYCTVTAKFLWEMYFHSTACLLGSDNALFVKKASDGGHTLISYSDNGKYVSGRSGIGRTVIEIYEDVSYGALKVTIQSAEVNSDDFICPLSYNFEVTQKSGTMNLPCDLKIMPGAEITIDESAEMVVSGLLAVMEGVVSDGNNGVTSAQTKAAGLSERGRLIVDGTLNVTGGIGGKIETNGQGVVNLNGTNSVTVIEGNSKNTYNLKAKLMIHDTKYTQEASWTEVGKGTYYGVSDEKWSAGTDAEKYFYYNNGSKSQYSDSSAMGTWSASTALYDDGSSVTTTKPEAQTGKLLSFYSDVEQKNSIEEPLESGVTYYELVDCEHNGCKFVGIDAEKHGCICSACGLQVTENHKWVDGNCTGCEFEKFNANADTDKVFVFGEPDCNIAVAASYQNGKLSAVDVNEDGTTSFVLPGLETGMTVKVFLLDDNHAPINNYVPEAKTVN